MYRIFYVTIGTYVAYKCTCVRSCESISRSPLSLQEQATYYISMPTSRVLHHKMGLTHNDDASTIKVGRGLSNYPQPNRCIDIVCSVGSSFVMVIDCMLVISVDIIVAKTMG